MSSVKVIWKWQIEYELFMPIDAEILHIGVQFGKPFLWARCDPSAPMATRFIWACPTGGQNPTDMPYIGTALISDDYVEHYFDGGYK